jgi:PQQ-dependent catabolism-associated CXXCW motif protein
MRPDMPWLPQPHRSLPGALWWPDVGRGALAPVLERRFHDRLSAALGPDRQRLTVFFCRADCWMSWNAAKRAASWGFHVAWFPGGIDAWTAAGLPMQIVQPQKLDQ